MPLPLIGKVINKLKNTKYFNKLDLIERYNNIQIKEDNKWKVVSLINKGLFEPKVMFLYEEVLANYMDNFEISTKTKKKLKERTV